MRLWLYHDLIGNWFYFLFKNSVQTAKLYRHSHNLAYREYDKTDKLLGQHSINDMLKNKKNASYRNKRWLNLKVLLCAFITSSADDCDCWPFLQLIWQGWGPLLTSVCISS